MADTDAAMAVLSEPGWGLLLDAGLALDDARGDALRAAASLAARRPASAPPLRAAALELVSEGARLAAKIGAFERLLAVRGAVEQATSGRVATWHAQRLPDPAGADGGARVLEIGCGCGGDSLALAHRARNLLAVDADPVRAACAHMNLAALGLSNARAVPGDGLDVLAGEGRSADVVFADPDRRPDGVRTLDPSAWRPSLGALAEVAATGRAVLVKAAPSLDMATLEGLGAAFDVAFVSHGGECVEAFLASRGAGAARGATPRVRAVLLPDGGPSVELEGDRGDATAGPVGDAILVPDPAAVRARLLAELCARHGATLVGEGIAWLTGPADVASPWLRVHRVAERCDVQAVPAALRRIGARSVRVHVRGVPVAAQDVERRWRGALDRSGGGPAADVFVTRFLGRPGAVVARD